MASDIHIALGLEGPHVEFEAFGTTVRELEVALRDIEENLTRKSPRVDWKWDDDPLVRVVATPNGIPVSTISEIVKQARLGFERVVEADGKKIEWPVSFGPKARRAITKVVQLLQTLSAITVATDDEPPLVIEHVKLQEEYGREGIPSEVTSIDGILDLISVRGRPHFSIEEFGTGRRIKCALPEDIFQTAKDALGHRVVVEGLLRYTSDGEPSILTDVTDLWVRPQEKRRIEDLRGALPDFMDDETAEDYVRAMRGELEPEASDEEGGDQR